MTFIEHLQKALTEAQKERKAAYKEMQKLTKDVIKLTTECKKAMESVGGNFYNRYRPWTSLAVFAIALGLVALFIQYTDACKFSIPIIEVEVTKSCGITNTDQPSTETINPTIPIPNPTST